MIKGDRHILGRCRIIVDAGGRVSSVAKGLGARRIAGDRLVCGWMHGHDQTGRQSGITHIEAERDGWRYTAPLTGNLRVVTFHTDSDLDAASVAAGPTLLQRTSDLDLIARVLSGSGFTPDRTVGFCAAHSAVLTPSTDDGWLAVGDAALGFDPLSSQGLFNALYTGLAGAEAADRALDDDAEALPGYQQQIASIKTAYRTHLTAWYGLERRWPDSPFWRRRHQFEDGPLPPPP